RGRCAAGDGAAHVLARGSADRVGGHVGAAAGGDHRGGAAGGGGRRSRRRGAPGPMVGVISPSMPVWVVENEARGNRAYCNFSEGYGQVLRFGAYGPEVVEHLRWMAAVEAPIIAAALELLPAPLDIRAISAQAVQMGDEVHNRNRAGTVEVFRALAPAFMGVDAPGTDVSEVARHIATNDYFYLNLSMASG